MLHNREEAEDATPQAFVNVCGRLKAKPDVNFLPYLKSTVANVCKDKLRRQKVTLKHQVLSTASTQTEHPSPEDAVITRTRHHLLQRAVDALPDMYREVLVLHYVCEYSYEQIAESLNQPLSIIKNRILRGKKLLRDVYLKIEGGDDR